MTVTMNKKAAKTYNDTEVHDAKVLADKQGGCVSCGDSKCY